jgi:hypothetical protein
MRPVIGDGRARTVGFRIGFDEKNARIIRMVASEVSALGIRHFQQLSPRTREQLLVQYQLLARDLPKDPAAGVFINLLAAQTPPRSIAPTAGNQIIILPK